MLDSPEAPQCEILTNTTNVRESLPFHTSQLPTPLDDGKSKRRRSQSDETPTKRPRLMVAGSSNAAVDVDVDMEDVTATRRRGCYSRRTAFRMLGLASDGCHVGPHRLICKSYSSFLRLSSSKFCSAISQ